jgi:hypothetical protein
VKTAPFFSLYQARRLAVWYVERGNELRDGINLDQAALDQRFRRLLADVEGCPEELVDDAFKQIMGEVFR